MPAPLAKGIIIAASVIVAAGIAIYQSPEVRQWVDQSRRKIAIALHHLGDEIQPRRRSESSEDYETRRANIIRQRRNELVRRCREEGVAVDLDELASIGRDDVEMTSQRPRRRKTNASQRSFDDMVGKDGRLKADNTGVQTVTGSKTADNNVRRRGVSGFAAGGAVAAASNPFADEAGVLFDRDNEEDAKSPEPFPYVESRESSATLGHEDAPSSSPPTPAPLIDLTPESDEQVWQAENPQTASIPQSEASVSDDKNSNSNDEEMANSFYSFTSSPSHSQNLAMPEPNTTHPDLVLHPSDLDSDDNAENMSTGTLTPRSERSAFTSASVVGSQADDIAVISMAGNDTDRDDRSEVFSEGGFTDVEGASQRMGVLTPNSWTDIGSDDESEWGGVTQGGNGGQVNQ